MRSEWETLRCEARGAVAVLTLHRPEQLNTMDLAMRDELCACITELRGDPAIAAVVITGAGEAFSAGGDMNDFVGRSPEQMHELMSERSHRWFRALWELPIPTVAALNGVAAGGGANLVLACDFVLASERAQLGETFMKVGLMPDLAGLFMLPRTVGLHQAKALALTAELIDARRLSELGIAYAVIPAEALLDEAVALAGRLAELPARAYAATKRLLNGSFEMTIEQLLAQELYAQSFLFSTDEHRDRRDAFLGRGEPRAD
ncbi:MAG TPA: enoyl-CoA hydratase-related protein [Solirubrobacteraceae bacterium]|nr:enoyl-CoA hydratase-related protein [Solirubrobacteraceae bacterium]